MTKRAAPHRGIDLHYGDTEDTRPSKTQLKQKSHDLQTLGEEVSRLSDERLERLELPDALRDAILELRRTRSHEGRRRQLQYVGKLMRGADEDRLREAVAESQIGSARETLQLHEAERWRDELVADDDALTRFAAQHPDADLQQLRALIRQARKDTPTEGPPGAAPRHGRAYREIFKTVKAALAARESSA